MKYFIPIIILSLFLLGCKKDDDSSTTTTELEGTWKTPCFASGTAYRTKSLIVTGTTLVDTTDVYSDSSCTTEKSTWVDTYSSLNIGNEINFDSYGSSGGSGHKFTLTLDTITGTPLTASDVTTLNTYSYCGDSDWALNTAKSLLGKNCNGVTEWSAGTAAQGVYLLDGSKIFFGIGLSYPSSVDTGDNDTFTKQ